MCDRELPQFPHDRRMSPEPKLGFRPRLDRQQPQLLQSLRLSPREVLIGELAERRPSPQRQSSAEQRRRDGRVAVGARRSRLDEQPVEPRRVQHPLVELEGIAEPVRANPCPLRQRLPQPRHVQLQRLRRVARWPLSPERLDQDVDRAGLPGISYERRQQPPRHRRQPHRPIRIDDLNGTEDPNFHRPSFQGDLPSAASRREGELIPR
jgi:hypothetical protein